MNAGQWLHRIINLKSFLFILAFFVYSAAGAQTSFLKEAVAKFDKAILAKDTVVLKQLLHKDLSYGHSNAWVETKGDLLKNLFNGKITYTKIEAGQRQWLTAKDWANVRTTMNIEYVMDGKEGSVTLHVLQVWMKTNKGWQMIARQGAKQ